jgi:hypothetical protein
LAAIIAPNRTELVIRAMLGLVAFEYLRLLAGAALKQEVMRRAKLIKLQVDLERIRIEADLLELEPRTTELRKKLQHTDSLLTMLRFRQLDMRLAQTGPPEHVKTAIRKMLSGLRSIAEMTAGLSVAEDEDEKEFQRGIAKGLDVASAAIFAQIAELLAEEEIRVHPKDYYSDNPEIAREKLAQLERDWLFKHELDLSKNP